MEFLVSEGNVLVVKHLLCLCWNLRSSSSGFFWGLSGDCSVDCRVEIVLADVCVVEASDGFDEIAKSEARIAEVRRWWVKIKCVSNVCLHLARCLEIAITISVKWFTVFAHPDKAAEDSLDEDRLKIMISNAISGDEKLHQSRKPG